MAESIKVGCKIKNAENVYEVVRDINARHVEAGEAIYNLNVEEYHTYFVGENRVLVHNDCSVSEADLKTVTDVGNKGDAEVKSVESSGMEDGEGSEVVSNPNNNLKVITDIINKNGLTIDEFNELRLTNPSELSSEEVKTMQAIRDEIPKIGPSIFIQKTIPECDIEGYLSKGWNKIGGYVAKYGDVSHIKNYDDVVESSRLDYVNADGKRPYPEGGNAYGYIKFKTKATDEISIPYGKVFGGTNTDGAPCTLNGFTGARNGEIIPEWMLDSKVTPVKGSELHKVINGNDTVIGIFDGKNFISIGEK